jgi:hypothetical protein
MRQLEQQLQRTPQSAAYNRVVDLHHTKEVYARQRARIVVSCLRQLGQRGKATETEWLKRHALKTHQISPDHVQLFVDIVQATINKDLEPRPAKKEIAKAQAVAAAPKQITLGGQPLTFAEVAKRLGLRL